MNSPLKEIVQFTIDNIPLKDLVYKLRENLTLKPPAKSLTKTQLKGVAEEEFLKRLLTKLEK